MAATEEAEVHWSTGRESVSHTPNKITRTKDTINERDHKHLAKYQSIVEEYINKRMGN